VIHFSDSLEKKSLSEIASSTEFSSILSKGENIEDARDYPGALPTTFMASSNFGSSYFAISSVRSLSKIRL